jgi:hypothetical protein
VTPISNFDEGDQRWCPSSKHACTCSDIVKKEVVKKLESAEARMKPGKVLTDAIATRKRIQASVTDETLC